MAFKTLNQFNEERFGGFFLLRNDGDSKDVVFLYQSINDVLVADVHYIKSPDYSGYVHCVGRGCPPCGQNIRVDTKLFIPLYDIQDDEVVFWDRSGRFEQQLMSDVFNKYPNPSEIVFRITRKGAAGDQNTRYIITAVAKNTSMSYAAILASKNVTFPEHYNIVCKDYDANKLRDLLNSHGDSASSLAEYQASPRVSVPQTNGNFASPVSEVTSSGIELPEANSVVINDSGDDGEDPEF